MNIDEEKLPMRKFVSSMDDKHLFLMAEVVDEAIAQRIKKLDDKKSMLEDAPKLTGFSSLVNRLKGK